MLVPVRRVLNPAAVAACLRLRQLRGRAVDLHGLRARVGGDELGRRAGGDSAPVRHDHDGVGKPLGLLDVVRGHEDRGSLGAQRVDQGPELLPHLRVEADGRLVEQEEPRSMDESPRDQQSPAHAARELVDPVVTTVGKVRDLERPFDRSAAVGAADRGRGA